MPESVSGRRRTAWLGIAALMAATMAWQFGRAPAGGPTSAAGANVEQVALAAGSEAAQTFVAPWNNFRRVRIRVAVDGSPSGTLQIAIDRMGPRGDTAVDRDIRQVSVSVRQLKPVENVELTFPPLADSAGQRYRLRVSVQALVDGTLAIAANRDNSYPLGSLSVNGREQPGDLVFAAFTSTSTAVGLLRVAIGGRPWPFSSPITFWILMAVFCLTVSRLVVLAAEAAGTSPSLPVPPRHASPAEPGDAPRAP